LEKKEKEIEDLKSSAKLFSDQRDHLFEDLQAVLSMHYRWYKKLGNKFGCYYPSCLHTYDTIGDLNRHLKNYHLLPNDVAESLKCPKCGFVFFKEWNRKRHVENGSCDYTVALMGGSQEVLHCD
jgi:uncharacterized C2H2 Zn-finger protein